MKYRVEAPIDQSVWIIEDDGKELFECDVYAIVPYGEKGDVHLGEIEAKKSAQKIVDALNKSEKPNE